MSSESIRERNCSTNCERTNVPKREKKTYASLVKEIQILRRALLGCEATSVGGSECQHIATDAVKESRRRFPDGTRWGATEAAP